MGIRQTNYCSSVEQGISLGRSDKNYIRRLAGYVALLTVLRSRLKHLRNDSLADRKTQQQRLASPTLTFTCHASKYKVHKLYRVKN